MNVKGSYGTVFECHDYSHSDMPVTIRTADGCEIDVPTSDLMAFAHALVEHHDAPPIIVNAKAQKFLKCAIDAATEGHETTIQELREELARLKK